eukprot:gnl/Spiro4/11084_TR5875_c0_g1_i1.p1 gnl/Spiro4/11084_TR5875_c0_g1~~gnl/Spiro4/11084_TR5875_c0_g1_i1.p1  ORF type:complete len:142 (+),score=8.22 gnl/Spiro4/11084_TR5875_c0_g1_i1:104-529(+)
MSKFKDQHPFEQRQNEALRVRLRYPNKTPVIVERDASARDDVPDLEKTKFLIPNDYTMGQLMFIPPAQPRPGALSLTNALFLCEQNDSPCRRAGVERLRHPPRCGLVSVRDVRRRELVRRAQRSCGLTDLWRGCLTSDALC